MQLERVPHRAVSPHDLADQLGLDDVLAELAAYSQEGVLTRMADKAKTWLDVVDLTHVLRTENKLSPTFLLRAICLGEVHVFESGIATLAQIPLENACQLIRDPNQEAFSRLYKKAGLPAQMFKGFRIALDFALRPRKTEWNDKDTAGIIDAIVRNHRRRGMPQCRLA